MSQTYEVDESYQGVGKLWARKYGTSDKLRFLGNVSKASAKQKLKTNKIADYTRQGGGTRAIHERLDSVTLAMTWMELSTENLALCIGSDVVSVAGATVAAEPVTFHKGGLVKLEQPPQSITSVASTGGSPITYQVGRDYELCAGGLYIPSTSTVVDASAGTVTYESADFEELEAATVMSTDLELFIEGLNDMDGNPMLIDVWKLHVPVIDELMLLGGDAPITLTYDAELLRDATKGAGKSGFFRARKVKLNA
ncbi:hypothetical protein [Ideonella sp.]|uniref:phage tail tube protein n=1 Tax=Ideonella sp. TaxID=1929293 RepID=UPI003BB48910